MTTSADKDIQAVVTATTAARKRIDERRSAIRAQIRAVNTAKNDPLPKPDIIARAKELIAADGAQALEKFGSDVLYGLSAIGCALATSPRLPWDAWQPVPWAVLCAAQPEHALAIVTGLVNALVYEPGSTLATRPEQLAALERELAQMEADEEALTDEAIAAGLNVQHRPEVQNRRNREARQAKLNAAHAAHFEANPPYVAPQPMAYPHIRQQLGYLERNQQSRDALREG